MTAILFPGAKVLLLGNYLSRHQTSHHFGMTFRGFCHCIAANFRGFSSLQVKVKSVKVK